MITSGLSGNEIFCLKQLGFQPGEILVGNSVYSLGFVGSLSSGFKNLMGGEIHEITSLISSGREQAIDRLEAEAVQKKAYGITGVSSEFIHHMGSGNIEFLSIGSGVHQNPATDQLFFSSSVDAAELYCNLDAGYNPRRFVFGNVAYALGLGRGFIGSFKKLIRGEIKEYSDIFNHTRHIALERIVADAKANKANSVVSINTKIVPYSIGVTEMLMMGTASNNAAFPAEYLDQPVTSDLTATELWSITNMGLMPLKLVLGTSVFSLGFMGGLSAALKAFVRGEISELTTLIYEAREKAIGLINDEAKSIGAEDILGVKTYMYDLGNGLLEFMAIGTAVKKNPNLKTKSANLIPQAIIADKDTYFDSPLSMLNSMATPGHK